MERLAVFDLDGTLIKGNSMKMFAWWLFGQLARRHRWGLLAASVWAVGVRQLRLVSHRDMKWRLLGAASKALDQEDYRRFAAERLAARLRPSVTQLVEGSRANSLQAVLATAAPEIYAVPLARHLGIAAVCATPYVPGLPLSAFRECRGRVKLSAVQRLGTPAVVATDHADDLPLLVDCARHGGTNYLVSPSPTTLMTVGAASIPFLPLS